MQKSVAIATWDFGLTAVQATAKVLESKGSCIDAVLAGINTAELDTQVVSVGFGGMPNSQGVMEMDAAIMDGANHNVGSVAGLQNIRQPISVAKAVMEKSQHSLLVGQGAQKFAADNGFELTDALFEEAKVKYNNWLKNGELDPEFMHDTIGLLAMDSTGHIVAGCSTSGMAFKHPGRVGDSPIIGSGLYADNSVGAAAATGNGDEILKFCMSFATVEAMRFGKTAQQACDYIIERFVEIHPEMASEDINVIALSKTGETAAGTLRKKFPFGVYQQGKCELKTATRKVPK